MSAALIVFTIALGAVLGITLGMDVLIAYAAGLPIGVSLLWWSRKEETFSDRVREAGRDYDELQRDLPVVARRSARV